MVMTTTSRAVITQPRRVEMQSVPLPALGPQDILVRARKSLLSSGTDRVCFRADFAPGTHWAQWIKYPFTPGYSMVGEVVATGSAVRSLAVGDRVATRAGYQTYAVAEESRSYRIPDGVSDEDAVWFALSAIAQHAVRRGAPQLGDHAAVIGLGPLGQLVARYAAVAGAATVWCVGGDETRLAAARHAGATTVTAAAARDRILEANGGVDVAYDVTGSPSVLAAASEYTAAGGTIVLVGDTPFPARQVVGGEVLRRSQTVVGVHDSHIQRAERTAVVRWPFRRNVGLFFDLVAQRRLDLAGLVTHRFPGGDVAGAFQRLDDDLTPTIGILVDWTE